MNSREILGIARRYTFAFGNGYLSTFLSVLSMAGLVLAISLLIIVLSVMNGFDKEMRERILDLVPHVTIHAHLPIENWEDKARILSAHPDVESVSPFSQFDALLMRGGKIDTVRVVGLELGVQDSPSQLVKHLPEGGLTQFIADPRGLILGAAVAEKLGVTAGDALTILAPAKQSVDLSSGAHYESVILRAILNTGTELDQSAAILHLPLASKVAGLGTSVSGLRLSTRDIFDVSRVGWELVNNLPTGYYATNWMMTHGNLYSAIQLSRDLISILLFSIIAVAAFNVVSSLVLVVFDKRGDIAILRTLGTSPREVACIFVLQGAMIGCVGVLLGSALGLLGSLLVTDLVSGLEQLLDIHFLNTDVYPVSFLPVDILPGDILFVGGTAFTMCVLAAIYPALRAARMSPAMVLHQE
ncbi:MAG: lipoprotein-releasing ABC transporter permease subunit [Halioglobus sp.]